MLTRTGSGHSDRAVPVVRSSDDHRIHVGRSDQLLIGLVDLRSGTKLTVRTLPMDVGTGELSTLRIDIEDVTNRSDLYVQVVLLHILLITGILAILLVGLLHLVDPCRLSETGGTHQLFTTNTETNYAQANLLAVSLRLQVVSLLVADLKDI